MKVRVKSVSDNDIWYASCTGCVFDVFSSEGAYYYIPIPFEYLNKFLPFLLLFKKDCEVINGT